MYLNGAGDFPIVMNQYDMGNLEFTLVDSNYYPIKLFSPMFVILKVEKTANPMEDIKVFQGKLPRDRPTPQQVQQMQIENQKKAQHEEHKQIVIDALAKVAEQLLPPTLTNPPPTPEVPVTAPVAAPVTRPNPIRYPVEQLPALLRPLGRFLQMPQLPLRPQDMDDNMREDILREQRIAREVEQEILDLDDPSLLQNIGSGN
jgi:hypothetical protein